MKKYKLQVIEAEDGKYVKASDWIITKKENEKLKKLKEELSELQEKNKLAKFHENELGKIYKKHDELLRIKFANENQIKELNKLIALYEPMVKLANRIINENEYRSNTLLSGIKEFAKRLQAQRKYNDQLSEECSKYLDNIIDALYEEVGEYLK